MGKWENVKIGKLENWKIGKCENVQPLLLWRGQTGVRGHLFEGVTSAGTLVDTRPGK